MDAGRTNRCIGLGRVGRTAQPIALLVAAASLLALLGCATPTPSPAQDGETATAARSRCAPGALLDDRHSLCNGQSGRWW